MLLLPRLLLLSPLILVMSCAFHLKGEANLSPQLQQINVLLSDDKVFNVFLIKKLKAAGASIVKSNDVAFLSVHFNVSPEITIAKSVATGLNIRQLRVNVTYSLKNKQGTWLVQQKHLQQSREFESNSEQILAKNKEKQQQYLEMKKNLVSLLMYQLQLIK